MVESKASAAAQAYLRSLLSKTLRITASDCRLFVGEFKCTDADRNIILSHTYEYRLPTSPTTVLPTTPAICPSTTTTAASSAAPTTIRQDMTSRYLGLVVVPGEHIIKIEVEEFASQVVAGGGVSAWERGWREGLEGDAGMGT